jgi:hypothetical protein
MNKFFKLTALAGLLVIAGQSFAVDDITRIDQIPVLKEEPQHATVSERDIALYPFSLPAVRSRQCLFGKNFRSLSEPAGLQP